MRRSNLLLVIAPPVINDDFQVIVAWIVAKFIYQIVNNCEIFINQIYHIEQEMPEQDFLVYTIHTSLKIL